MVFVALVLLVLVTMVCILYFYDPRHVEEEAPQVCGVMEFDTDPIERAVFLKKAPFKSKQTINVHIQDVKDTTGAFKKHVMNIVKKDVAPHVNLKFRFVTTNTPSASGALITVNNDDGSLVEKGMNGFATGVGKPKVTIGIRDGSPARTVIHEFGHALGLLHEHFHTGFAGKLDLNKIVDTKMAAAPSLDRATVTKLVIDNNFKKLNAKNVGYTPLYDSESVMLYSFNPKQTTEGVEIVGGSEFSAMDKAQLKKMYP